MAKQADDKNFEDLFRKRLADHEEIPPPMAWEEIAPKIGKNGVPYWRYGLPLLLLLLLFFGVGYWAWEGDEQLLGLREQTKVKSDIVTNHNQKQEEKKQVVDSPLQSDKKKNTEPSSKQKTQHIKVNTTRNSKLAGLKSSHTTSSATKQVVDKLSTTNVIIPSNNTTTLGLGIDTPLTMASSSALSELHSGKPTSVTFFASLQVHLNQVTRPLLGLERQEVSILPEHTPLLPVISKVEKTVAVLPKRVKQPASYSFFIAPNYSYERLVSNKSDEWLISSNSNMNEFNWGNVGLSTGLGYRKPIGKGNRLAVFGNVEYTLLRKARNVNLASSVPTGNMTFLDTAGTLQIVPQYTPATYQSNMTYHLLGLRLGVAITPFANQPNQQLILAGGTDALLKFNLTPKGLLTLEHKQFIHPVGMIGYEVSYPVSANTKLKIMPYVNYYFSSLLTKESSLGVKPYTFGLRLSISFQSKSKKGKLGL